MGARSSELDAASSSLGAKQTPTGGCSGKGAGLIFLLIEAVQDPEFRNAMEKLRAPIVYKDADELQGYVDADARRLTAVIQKIGKVE